MFLGHYGIAFALKRAESKLSLGTLFIAVQFPDLLWGIFVLLGWEHARLVPGYTAVTPLLSMFGTHTFESYVRVKLQTEFVNP